MKESPAGWQVMMVSGWALTVPVGHVLVCDARRHVKHDDAALAIDVVAIAKTAKLLLACRVPDVKLKLAKVLHRGRHVRQQRLHHAAARGGGACVYHLSSFSSSSLTVVKPSG